MAIGLHHLFVYNDEYEGGSISDFRGAYDTLDEARKALDSRKDSDYFAYIAFFDDEKRAWEIVHHYNWTNHPILPGGDLEWKPYTEYIGRPYRWVEGDYRNWHEMPQVTNGS